MLSKINAWLHLWLGLAAGIPVVILSITGCVLVFEHDIKEFTTNYIRVEAQRSEDHGTSKTWEKCCDGWRWG